MADVRRPTHFFSGYVFDLDGTVYLGDAALPGAREVIAAVRGRGARVVFLSNNPLRTRAQYAGKLTSLGIATRPEDVINSSCVLVEYLQRRAPGRALFVVGEDSVKGELRAAGFRFSETPQEIDLVVACFDRTFDYRKLQVAFDAIRAGAGFIATNLDAYCPVPGGGLPDCGAIVAAIEACTGKRVEAVMGKPSPIMGAVILEKLGLPPAQCVIVGDRLETDMALGHAVGIHTALVLTGATARARLAAWATPPEFVLERLADLLPG
ncbi:MAG: HAD-IIA family hydrolase [Armatimonadetes bacterium]|nr:HAD-IIA family hydrolase [Armatimonadota bacterium]